MAKIYHNSLFSWEKFYCFKSLENFKLIINNLPDEKLIRKLIEKRKKGRNAYPIKVIWNSVIAGILFQHSSIESLRRELIRNPVLAELCGFEPISGEYAIPKSANYTNFLKNLVDHQNEIDEIFYTLVKELKKILPNFGKILAGDGKALNSYGKESKKKKKDGRRDIDANTGIKQYSGINENGSLWKKVKSWFGYKLHLVVDAEHELPVEYRLTKASTAEGKIMKDMFSKMDLSILEKAEYALLDRGYDDEKLIKELYDKYNIKPIIDIRNMWRDGEKTKIIDETKNIGYDYKGTIYCYCPKNFEKKEMTFKGYEKKRKSLKYLCPAKVYGIKCSGMKKCLHTSGIRIPLSLNRRIFTPVSRSSYKWKRLYNARTSVERVNSRIDLSFGFDRHFIRGIKKMRIRCSLSLCVMLTVALVRSKECRIDLVRSLLKTG